MGEDSAIFQEVTGLDRQPEILEYRQGKSPSHSIKMPALGRIGNITLREGTIPSDSTFWGWLNDMKMSTIRSLTVMISLMDESGTPKMVWSLNNAFPTKMTASDPKSDSSEVAVESLELAFESLVTSSS